MFGDYAQSTTRQDILRVFVLRAVSAQWASGGRVMRGERVYCVRLAAAARCGVTNAAAELEGM